VSKTRTEAFSDGVFAVAATLLVFSLATPIVSSGLSRALLDEWPSYAAYAISFMTIVVIWVNHHVVVDAMDRIDRPFLFLNALFPLATLLALVSFKLSLAIYACVTLFYLVLPIVRERLMRSRN
jgi:uncharacterized membrane protein